MELPQLTPDEGRLLEAMQTHLREVIRQAGGLLPFDRFMEQALYAPGLGYYVNGRRRFGETGDFVTAPELSPLFGICLANQIAQCLAILPRGEILEFGAGSGKLAADILQRLEDLDRLPGRYLLLELSPDLQQLQRETLAARVPHLLDRVDWLQTLPDAGFTGIMIGNELLDAMPVQRFRRSDNAAWQELHVGFDNDGLADRWADLNTPGMTEALAKIWPDPATVPAGYNSELNLRLGPWLDAIAHRLTAGWVFLIDYGYTRREYYHAERASGTLICHFRHRAYADPYRLPGLQDITANVDFTALAEAAADVGFTVAGFTTQAHFLIDSGLEAYMAGSDPGDLAAHLRLAQGVKKLTLPSEMGERFKVIALARGLDEMLLGFQSRDLRARL